MKPKSIMLPTDLLEAAKAYEMQRQNCMAMHAKLDENYKAEQIRINMLYAEAENVFATKVFDSKLIERGTPFGIDARYAEHGQVFLNFQTDEDGPNPLRSKMN